MELTDEVKDFLRKIVTEAVQEALTVDITWEQRKDPETGVPLAAPKIANESIFLPSFFVQHLKFHEGAFRGSQETLDKVKNRSVEVSKNLEILGTAFGALEQPVVILERFVGLLAKTGIMERLEEIATIDVIGPETKKIGAEGENAGDNRQF